MSEREPGQKAYEAACDPDGLVRREWAELTVFQQHRWAAVEAAIRADAMREAARIVTEHYDSMPTEHRLLLVNRSTAILSAIGGTDE